MSNEPKASMGIDPELLAAYIDQRLSPEQRAAVEAQLAKDPDSYAVLVETLKALDDESIKALQVNDGGKQPLPFPAPKPKRGLSRRIVTGVLAVAAAVALVVWTQPDMLRRLGGGNDPALDRLVDAVGAERYIEARITGGFKYGPLRSPTRSSGSVSDQNLALLAAAGELQKLAAADPNPANLRRWGVAALLLEQWDEAVRALELSAGLEATAAIQSDLAAAYLARAQNLQRPDDLPRALAAAERALKADPTLLEALFNRALALELLHLGDQASRAWQEYAERDSSPWGELARERSARPRARNHDDEWKATLKRLENGDPDLTTIFSQFPEQSLRLAELELPAEWARAVLGGDMQRGSVLQHRLANAADASKRVWGDHLLSDFVAAIAGRDTAARRRIAADIVEYAKGRAHADAYEFAEAADILGRVLPRMRAEGDPLSAVVLLEYAAACRAARQIDQAKALMPGLAASAAPYPSVRARAHRLQGLVYLADGKYSASLAEYEKAASLFGKLGLRRSESLAAVLIAETLAIVGSKDVWKFHARGLKLAASGATSRELQSIMFTAGWLSMNHDLPEAAVHFFAAMVTAADSLGVPAAIAEAHLNRARAFLALGDRPQLEAEIENINRIDLPAGSHGDFLRGEWLSIQTESLVSNDPASAVSTAASAIAYATAKNRVALIPRLQLAAARAHRRLNNAEAAAEALSAGIRQFETLWNNIEEDSLRITHFDLLWDLYGELADLQVSLGDPLQALDTLERSQGRSVLAARNASDKAWNRQRLETSLRDDAVVIYLLPAELATTVWLVRKTGTEAFHVPVGQHEIHQAVGASTANSRYIAAIDVGRRLLAPLARELRDATAIGFVAQGALAKIPWSAVEVSPGAPLIDRATVQLIPNGSFALRPAPVRDYRTARALVVAAGAEPRDGLTRLRPLPGASTEATAVAARYPSASLLLDGAARREAVLAALETHDVFHFAGHAVSNESTPSLSRLIVGEGGVISAKDVSELPRSNIKLAILTACSTASGPMVRSEGAIGVSRMWLAKGADAVIGTLGDVSDRAASRFGESFHAALFDGASPAEALRHGQRDLRALPLADANEWSSFVLIGGASHLTTGGVDDEQN